MVEARRGREAKEVEADDVGVEVGVGFTSILAV